MAITQSTRSFPALGLAMVPPFSAGGARLSVVLSVPTKSRPDQDIFTVVQGTWAWTTADSNCATDPPLDQIHAPTTRAMIHHGPPHPYRRPDGRFDSVAFYDIRAHTRSSIRGANSRRDAHDRKTAYPVVWEPGAQITRPVRVGNRNGLGCFGSYTRENPTLSPAKGTRKALKGPDAAEDQ